ncbi:hypothetical protein Tco_0762853 [Tanacetum coccineum]
MIEPRVITLGRPALIPPDVGQRKELFGVESPSEESHCSFPLRALRSYFLWHPRFEPFVTSVVVNVAAVVVIGVSVVVIVVVIVAAVVVESLVGLAKGRPALTLPDVGQWKVDSFTITLVNRLMVNAKKPRLVSGSRFTYYGSVQFAHSSSLLVQCENDSSSGFGL